MTQKQIELIRHALGLGRGHTVSYRRYFVAGGGHEDHEDWLAMERDGCAIQRKFSVLPAGDVLFIVTRKGAEAALQPGESLCAEDFPS
jgi:hypothetical protein